MEGLGDLEGKVIGGRYTLGHKLGQGGMGAVYAATQTSLGRRVAIKLLLPILSGDPALIARFQGEAERAGRLNHPNIVQVLDFGREADGSVWIAMELLEGEALTDRIERGALSEAEVVAIAKSTLAGLEAAHADHLVHRDLKPDNIFLARTPGVGDVVKILDFGIAKLLDGDSTAKLTATGLVIGTPLYMSPEQARGDDLDQRSDLYSLGAVMYEALTGQPPFTGRNYNALLVAVLTDTPRPIQEVRPDLSPELADVVMRALSKEPAHRFTNAHEMSVALSTFTPKTELPPARQDIGLASTMATPQIGSVTPVNITPIAGGVGTPIPTRASDGAAAASAAHAATAPMSEAGAPKEPPKKKTRSHGWLVAMAFVALLAGVGGTYTFLNMQADSEPLAQAGPVAEVQPVVPATSATATPMPSADPGQPMDPTVAVQASGDTATATTESPSDEESSEEREARSDRAAARMTKRRPRGPAATIRASGGSFGQHREHRQYFPADYANWSSCWPRNMPFPDYNWGLNIDARSNPDGTLTNLRPGGSNLYPPIAQCIIRLLAGATLGPSADGEGHDVSLSFTFYPTQRRR